MTSYNRILSFDTKTGSWQNTSCDNRGNLNVNAQIVSNAQGSKGNVYSGDLVAGASSPHFNIKTYTKDSVITYEDNSIGIGSTVSIYVTSSANDAPYTGVSIGDLQPISTGQKRTSSAKLNLAPFSYLWVVNNANQAYPQNCNVSVYCA